MALPTPPQRPLRFRRELRVTPRINRGKKEFLLEDKASGRFHLLGAAEYYLACSFNGHRSVPEVIETAKQKVDDFDLHPPEVASLARWLIAAQIVEAPGARPAEPSQNRLAKATGGILYFRISLGSPDSWVKRLAPQLAWLFTLPALIAVLLSAAVAGAMILLDFAAFSASFSSIFAPDHQWRMLAAWVFLKAIHELGHAVACRRFGGEVRDCGVAFFFLAPAPYVDVTSCWRFPSKWQRISVALAGMYLEFIAAVFAALLWSFSSDLTTRQLCVHIISLATITTILFNANPLMRYDGYYALSDLLNWPNLAGDGKACVAKVARKYLLGAVSRVSGADSKSPAESPTALMEHPPTVPLFLYGLSSIIWQSATMLGLAIFAIAVYEGIGILISLAIAVPMFLVPISKAGAWLLNPAVPLKSRVRAAGSLAGAAALIALALIIIPWPQKMRSSGVVEFSQVAVLRAASPGSIVKLHVADGESVQPGQLIASLENAELLTKAQRDASDAELTSLRARGHLHQQRLSDYRTEDALSDARAKAVEESQRRVDGLSIYSPIAGVVMARRLADQEGRYLKEGDELCKVAQGQVEVRISIPQQDMERFQARIGQTVSVRLPSGAIDGEIISLDPMGSHSVLDPALLAPMGGPLAAKAKSASEKDANQEAWTLPEAHFVAKVRVDNSQLPAGIAGQRAEVSFYAWDRTIGRQIKDYFISRFQHAQQNLRGG
jgi:putative peptide zinc metalloprotease protein